MRKGTLALAFLAMLGVPFAATASTITGVLNVTGTIEISDGSIAFADHEFSINGPAASQQGGFVVLEGTTGAIDNITNPPDATGPLVVPDFITFDAAPNISITLTDLEPGMDGAAGCTATPPAAGQICTPSLPAQSPFDLTNLSATSSIASFAILGTEFDSLTGDSVPVSGVFTIPLSDQSFQSLLATVAGGGTVTSSFAAQFTTATSSVPPVPPLPAGPLADTLAGWLPTKNAVPPAPAAAATTATIR